MVNSCILKKTFISILFSLTLTTHHLDAKVLKHKNIETLNAYFGADLKPLLRIIKTVKATNKVLSDVTTAQKDGLNEKVFVAKSLSDILTPVQDFFQFVDQSKGFIKGIVVESLERETSLLVQYTQSADSIIAFCDKNVTTFKQLQTFASEIQQFFKDVESSLSDDVRQALKRELAHLSKPSQKN